MAPDERPSTKPLLDKLGVKQGSKVSVLDLPDEGFLRDLQTRAGTVAVQRRRVDCDLIFLGVEHRAGLRRLKTQRNFIKPDGAVWVVWPKGSKAINENDVREAALDAGLVDVKVVAFSPTHSALKLVIRRKDR